MAVTIKVIVHTDFVAHFLFGDQLVLHIHGELGVVADADLGHARHGAGIRSGQRDLVLASLVQFIQQRLVAIALAFDGRDLLRKFAIVATRAIAVTQCRFAFNRGTPQ